MTTPRRKAASLWSCGKCRREVRMEPGSDMLDRPCSVSGCSGRLRYRGGCFVEEGTVEFKVISNYYLVDEYRRQNKKL